MAEQTYTISYFNGVSKFTDTVTAEPGSTITGTAVAGAGFIFTAVSGARYQTRPGMYSYVSNFVATKISDYKYNYSFTAPSITTISLLVGTKAEPAGINIDTSKLVNCSISPSKVPQGTQNTVTLNADKGYILNGSGSYVVDGTTNDFTCANVSSYPITVTANTSVSISFKATQVQDENSNSTVHTYILSQDKYNSLGKQIITSVNSTGTGFETYDYTKFINYLYQIPFKVGTDITTTSSSINLGKQSLAIDCLSVTKETLNVDLGVIDLTDVHDSHDLQPLSITLYCPFSSNITLPSTVLNSKLYLSFAINLKTEQALLLIKQNGNVIYSGQTELFTDLPLYYSDGNKDTIVKQLKAQYQNTIKQAYIVVNYNKAITSLNSYKTKEHGTLSNYKGFIRVSNGVLNKSISSVVDKSLLTLLKQGVIIK